MTNETNNVSEFCSYQHHGRKPHRPVILNLPLCSASANLHYLHYLCIIFLYKYAKFVSIQI